MATLNGQWNSLSADEYIAELVRAEISNSSNANQAEIPEIDYNKIQDEETREKVISLT